MLQLQTNSLSWKNILVAVTCYNIFSFIFNEKSLKGWENITFSFFYRSRSKIIIHQFMIIEMIHNLLNFILNVHWFTINTSTYFKWVIFKTNKFHDVDSFKNYCCKHLSFVPFIFFHFKKVYYFDFQNLHI